MDIFQTVLFTVVLGIVLAAWSRRAARIMKQEQLVEDLYSWRLEDIKKVLMTIEGFALEGEANESELELAKALRINLARRRRETFNG